MKLGRKDRPGRAALRAQEAAEAGRGALGADLVALRDALDLGEGLLPADEAVRARALLARADERQSFATGRTVVALLGATGSGKSSLTNALVGREVSRVAARRPTTSRPLAAVWGGDDAGPLLDWLDIPERVQVTGANEAAEGPGGEDLSGLVLVDLPDIDSTHLEHRETVTRLAGAVDVLVWVLDPQKYADASIHHGFLAPMAEHAQVTVLVLNQIDTLEPTEREGILDHLRSLLADEGLGDSRVLAVSARTDEGIDELLHELSRVSSTTLAVHERLRADVRATGHALAEAAGVSADDPGSATTTIPEPAVDKLVDAATNAAGADAVAAAVRRSYRRGAGAHVGWPPVRWLAGLRSDPLKNLHLGGRELDRDVVRSSLPKATPVQEAGVRNAAQRLAVDAGEGLPDPWRARVLEDTQARLPAMIDDLDRDVVGTDTEADIVPFWWNAVGFLQWLALAAAVVGLGWLVGLWVADYLRFRFEAPMWGPVPVPTALLVGGIAVGLILWWIGSVAARVGARRRAERVRARIRAEVDESVRYSLIAPMEEDLGRFARLRAALARLAQGS